MPVKNTVVFCAGSTPACRYALQSLSAAGIHIADNPTGEVTHLLLDVPSFNPEGLLRGGGCLEDVLKAFRKDLTVCGGNLKHPALSVYRTVDLLQDDDYLAQNARITAECALDVAMPYLTVTLRDCPVLILGWGRIGKCLARLLHSIGANVTIAARKQSDRAMIRALGMDAADFDPDLSDFRLIFNTVPAPVLNREQMGHCQSDCVKIDLASRPGMEDDDIIYARGLPGIHVPESSGTLIAAALLPYL
jgi:dipicolinate synthase subunit A